jgi:hypothetical protein
MERVKGNSHGQNDCQSGKPCRRARHRGDIVESSSAEIRVLESFQRSMPSPAPKLTMVDNAISAQK